jgi:hypothetical protein
MKRSNKNSNDPKSKYNEKELSVKCLKVEMRFCKWKEVGAPTVLLFYKVSDKAYIMLLVERQVKM